MNTEQNIVNNVMLVQVSIRAWDAFRVDKPASRDTLSRAQAADEAAGRFNKRLVSKASLQPITAARSQLRDYVESVSLPWTDRGWRMIPATRFQEVHAELLARVSKFDALVTEFITHDYPREVAAARVRLGSLYRPQDYPTAQDLRSKFGASVQYDTLARDYSDLRQTLNQEDLDSMVSQAQARTQAALADSVKDLWSRVFETVSRMAQRLGNEKGPLYDTVITSAQDLASMLPDLNWTNDPMLAEAHKVLTEKLVKHSPDTLRANKALRADVAREAQQLTDALAGMF